MSKFSACCNLKVGILLLKSELVCLYITNNSSYLVLANNIFFFKEQVHWYSKQLNLGYSDCQSNTFAIHANVWDSY